MKYSLSISFVRRKLVAIYIPIKATIEAISNGTFLFLGGANNLSAPVQKM
jgi:hypothetical protein